MSRPRRVLRRLPEPVSVRAGFVTATFVSVMNFVSVTVSPVSSWVNSPRQWLGVCFLESRSSRRGRSSPSTARSTVYAERLPMLSQYATLPAKPSRVGSCSFMNTARPRETKPAGNSGTGSTDPG
ncbi:hypothetical protein [Streptomyces sp. NPDC012510]|uniref:hypothetical protein n=1 Tax=Streptomyces sp. NPDC012510 TaxID=3364838 RepID=UPI0036EE0EE8